MTLASDAKIGLRECARIDDLDPALVFCDTSDLPEFGIAGVFRQTRCAKRRKIMITKRIILMSLVGCLYLVGCRHPKEPQVSTAGQPTVVTETETHVTKPKDSGPSAETSDNPVIGHLQTRNKLITIRTGADGPLYSVKSKEGKILAVDLPATELSARFPELKKVVERGFAGDDASLRPRYRQIKAPVDLTPIKSHETRTIIIEHNK